MSLSALPGLWWLGDGSGRRTKLGPRWAQLTGQATSRQRGREWQKRLPADDRRRYLRQLKRAAADRQPLQTSYRVKDAAGGWRLIVEEAQPRFDRRGRLTGLLGVGVEADAARDAGARRTPHREPEADALRGLSGRLERVREEERSRLARELHDELGQVLTSTKLDLMWLCDQARQPGARPSLTVVNRLQSLAGLVEIAIVAVQRITTDLKSPVLDHLGLAAALEWEATKFQARTGIRCRVSAAPGQAIDDVLATTVFRIAQEALTNVARHARAGAVRLSLRHSRGRIVLEVQDNGRGITDDEARDPKSVGLVGMRERALQLGGEMQVSGTPGRGTKVLVSIPLRTPDA